ncbi:MAG: flavodoxin family protein, partial [Elusimicrobium sp.]|nr:flavodoxin family protein [Elusimicrobium sp.]
MMKIIAFNGSPRKNGNTNILIEKVLEPLKKAGAETKIIQVGGSGIKPCTGCRMCYKNKNRKCVIDDILNTFAEDVWTSDAVIIASPTYYANPTPEIRCLIDRLG